MATHGWRTNRPLSQALRSEASRFDFYQLVRLLLKERALLAHGRHSHDSLEEEIDRHIVFRADLGAAFPGHEVGDLGTTHDGRTVVHTHNYMLAGTLGPLPERLIEQMTERLRDGDQVMARFLDLFNQRIASLRYQLKSAHRLGLNLLPPDATPQAQMLAAIMGMAAPGLAEQMAIPRRQWLGLAGLLADPRRSAPVMTRVLAKYVGAPVKLHPFHGAWRDRPLAEPTLLGIRGHAMGQLARLGTRSWQSAARIELDIGPLPYAALCKLLPNGRIGRDRHYQRIDAARYPKIVRQRRIAGHGYRYHHLAELIRFLLSRRQDAWVRIKLDTDGAPAARLTQRAWQHSDDGKGYWGLRLGQTAWLGSNAHHQREARFLVRAYPHAGAVA